MKKLLLPALFLGLTACGVVPVPHTVPLDVVAVDFPTALTPGENLSVNVRYAVGCHDSNPRLLLERRTPSALSLEASATNDGTNTPCPAVYGEQTLTYVDSGTAPRTQPFEVFVNGKNWGKVLSAQEVNLAVTKVTLPATIGTTAPLNVGVEVTVGGCVSFKRFEASRTASSLTLKAIGNDVSGPGLGCTAEIRYETHTYTDAGTPARTNPFEVMVNSQSWGTIDVK